MTPRFTTDTGLLVELAHLTLTGGPSDDARDSWLPQRGDGWQFRATQNGMYAGAAEASVSGLAALGVDLTDRGLAEAILDQPAIAAALGFTP